MSRKLQMALVSVLCCCVLLLVPASAHSGGTDANGGHRDSSTGKYHYHHGYSAHQHPNGVCPYASTASGTTASSNETEESEDKSFRERVDEALTLDSLYETTKTKLKQANERINELSIEVAELKEKNTYFEKQNANLQAEIDTYIDKYLSIGIAVGIALVMGSIILAARNASLKRQLLSERKQLNEENSN